MVRVIALGGEPATGKTTIARRVVARLGSQKTFSFGRLKGSYHPHYHAYVLGNYQEGETFGGTDRLSMAVQPHAIKFLQELQFANVGNIFGAKVFFEGDRLFNQSFLEECFAVPASVAILCLEATDDEKRRRHSERRDTQSDVFLKGRRTKIANILSRFPETERLQNPDPNSAERIAQRIFQLLGGIIS